MNEKKLHITVATLQASMKHAQAILLSMGWGSRTSKNTSRTRPSASGTVWMAARGNEEHAQAIEESTTDANAVYIGMTIRFWHATKKMSGKVLEKKGDWYHVTIVAPEGQCETWVHEDSILEADA